MEEEVRAALEDIKPERAQRFLRHLLEAASRGESAKLTERALGVEFFGRPAEWDPSQDPVVRNEAGRLKKRLARYYETDGAQAEVRIHLPAGSFVPVFMRRGDNGFPIDEPELEEHVHAWWYVAAGVLILASIFAGWLYWHAFRTAR